MNSRRVSSHCRANNFDQETVYLNDGFIYEEQRLVDPNNAALGTIPFHRQYITGNRALLSASGRDKDIGFYVQDTWKAGTPIDDDARRARRSGAALRLAARFLAPVEHGSGAARRLLVSVDVGREERAAWHIRAGARAVAGRTARRVVVRRCRCGSRPRHLRSRQQRHLRAGVRRAAAHARRSQPAVRSRHEPADHRRVASSATAVSSPGRSASMSRFIYRKIHNMFAQTDINGIYPDGPNQPFRRVRPRRSRIRASSTG